MLRPNSGRERALFGRNRGDEAATCKKPQARRHTHLGPETASGSGDYVAASTAIGARAVQRLHRDRGLTLQAGAAALRRRQGKSHSKLASCTKAGHAQRPGFSISAGIRHGPRPSCSDGILGLFGWGSYTSLHELNTSAGNTVLKNTARCPKNTARCAIPRVDSAMAVDLIKWCPTNPSLAHPRIPAPRPAFRSKKYVRTNLPSRSGSGPPQERHVISDKRFQDRLWI